MEKKIAVDFASIFVLPEYLRQTEGLRLNFSFLPVASIDSEVVEWISGIIHPSFSSVARSPARLVIPYP